MQQALAVLRGCRLGLHVISVLTAIASLATFIIATARGIHPPAIGAGYIAALFCLAVNIYVLAAWWNVRQQKSNAGRWSRPSLIIWCLLHLFTAILTIGLSVAITMANTCDEDDDDDDDDDEEDEDSCNQRALALYVGGGLLIALFVFHLIFFLGTFASMWVRRQAKRAESDPEKNQAQHDTTAPTGGLAQSDYQTYSQSEGPHAIPAVQPSYGIPQRKEVPQHEGSQHGQHQQQPGASREAQSMTPSSVAVSSLDTSQQESSSPQTVPRQVSPQVPHTMAAVASESNPSTYGGQTHAVPTYNNSPHGVSELTSEEAYTELPAQTPVASPTQGRAELG